MITLTSPESLRAIDAYARDWCEHSWSLSHVLVWSSPDSFQHACPIGLVRHLLHQQMPNRLAERYHMTSAQCCHSQGCCTTTMYMKTVSTCTVQCRCRERLTLFPCAWLFCTKNLTIHNRLIYVWWESQPAISEVQKAVYTHMYLT